MTPDGAQALPADERAQFEADAAPMGFDLTRYECAAPEPWSEYAALETGHRWGGWLARAALAAAPPAVVPAEPVAWMLRRKSDGFVRGCYSTPRTQGDITIAALDGDEYEPLYATPPVAAVNAAAPVPVLTDAEILKAIQRTEPGMRLASMLSEGTRIRAFQDALVACCRLVIATKAAAPQEPKP